MKEQIEKILDYYRTPAQLIKLIEELSELTKEVCKALNYNGNRKNIIEEIADVQVMLEQLKIIYQISEDELNTIIQEKVDRTIERISK